MATTWICPSCKENLDLHLGDLAASQAPCCPFCQTRLEPCSVSEAELDSNVGVGCALGSFVILGGGGLVGYLVMHSEGFRSIGRGWVGAIFALILILGVTVSVLYAYYAEIRRERKAKKNAAGNEPVSGGEPIEEQRY